MTDLRNRADGYAEDYAIALEAAGATVLDYREWGDYQGTWVAFVEHNGEKVFVSGAFGSCSGCDHFQDEFGWKSKDDPELYQKRLAEFGAYYLNQSMSADEALKEFSSPHKSWDDEMVPAREWVNSLTR